MEGDRRTWAKRTRKPKLLGKMKISKKNINFWWSLLFWGRYNGCHLSWWVQCGLQCWNCSTTSLLSDSFLSDTQSYSSGRAMGQTDGAESKGKKKKKGLKKKRGQLNLKLSKRLLDSSLILKYTPCRLERVTVWKRKREQTHVAGSVHHRLDFPFTGFGWFHLNVGSHFVLRQAKVNRGHIRALDTGAGTTQSQHI